MPEVQFVRASAQDKQHIAEIVHIGMRLQSTTFISVNHPGFVRGMLADSTVYLIEDAGCPVGYVAYRTQPDGSAYLRELAVQAHDQGRGIAGDAIHHILDELAEAPEITLHVHRENERAQRIYERFGFFPARKAPPANTMLELRRNQSGMFTFYYQAVCDRCGLSTPQETGEPMRVVQTTVPVRKTYEQVRRTFGAKQAQRVRTAYRKLAPDKQMLWQVNPHSENEVRRLIRGKTCEHGHPIAFVNFVWPCRGVND